MTNKIKKVPLKEKIAIILLLLTLVTNPLTGQYVEVGIQWAFQQVFIYGSWISLAFGVYIAGLGLFYYYKYTRVVVPAKNSKTGTKGGMKYIVTE